MIKYRVISDGHQFKVQAKYWWWFWWSTAQRPANYDEKDFGGDRYFGSKQEAEEFIKSEMPRKWKVV